MSTLEERFEAKVNRTGDHHLWTGSKRRDGAGQLKVNGRPVTAHRVAWELENGPLPAGAHVSACPADKACVRVEHLFASGVSGPAAEPSRRRPAGAGSLRQLRPGVWKLTVTLGRYDDGRPRREYLTIQADTQVEAEREAAAFVADLDPASLPEKRSNRDLTTDEVVDQYLEHLRDVKGREMRTVEGYRDVYEKWWSDLIGQSRFRKVDGPDMDRGFGRMRRAGVGHSRMNQARSLFVPMSRWAQDRRIIRRLPIVQGYELPKSTKTPKKRVPPEANQLAVYLSTAVEVVPDVAPVLTLVATSGMRRGEVVVGRRNDLDVVRQRLRVAFAADLDGSLKRTKTDEDRDFALDPDTITMLLRHFEQMDVRAAACGAAIADDAFIFSLAADCSVPMPVDYFTKQVAKLKEHLGIADKRPETVALEDEALRLFRQPRPPRPAGRRGPPPKGGMSHAEIGDKLDRSAHWVKKALVSAQRREAAGQRADLEMFDGSIVALRKFSSSGLLDAGFNVKVAADRQGHSPETLLKHYAKRRRSADIKGRRTPRAPRARGRRAESRAIGPVPLRYREHSMSTQNGKRQELGLTQTEAARRAGVSLPTWRRWEADPSQVSEATDAKCRKVLDREPLTSDVDWSSVEVWRDHLCLTPRQAAALVYELNGFGDVYLAEWLNYQHDPLHDTPPFDQLDRRVMFHVGDNQAWVAEARDRCYAVASWIEEGKLPHDQVACFFDEFVIFAACNVAAETYADKLALGLFDQIPARECRESEDEADWMTGDEDWEELEEWLVDESAWDVHAMCGPRGLLSPLVQIALAQHHPFTWFDLPAPRSAD